MFEDWEDDHRVQGEPASTSMGFLLGLIVLIVAGLVLVVWYASNI